ncbi:uncharacterized protein ATNIH1004_000461 [Aspergillus tanneri]|nr:uncharacterized protein ATNIH1004_000461 [Aspergillus tanneri]KAA8651571.1 hypothetical protein ATNIH1004_000461 [Aspergillus tanneri]
MAIFGMGIFVIVAPILHKIYCLVPSLISYVYMNCYFREVTEAVLVINLPIPWPLLRDVLPALKIWTDWSEGAPKQYQSNLGKTRAPVSTFPAEPSTAERIPSARLHGQRYLQAAECDVGFHSGSGE